MDQEHFVFRDPYGGRWRSLSRAALLSSLTAALALGAVLYSLLVPPRLLSPPSAIEEVDASRVRAATALTQIPEHLPKPPSWLTQGTSGAHTARPASLSQGPTADRGVARVRLGLLDDDPDRALVALRAHAKELTHIAPSWFQLVGMPPALHETPDPEVAALADSQGLALMPLLTNLGEEGFEPEAVEELARSGPAQQRAFAQRLKQRLRAIGAKGVIIAWEKVDPTYRRDLVTLIGRLHEELQRAGLELWLSVPVGNDIQAFDLEALVSQVDRLVAVLYYQTGEEDAPGPLAALAWFREWLDALAHHGDPAQWIIGLGAFASDWPESGAAELISFQDAMARAAMAKVGLIANLPPYEGLNFSYILDGVRHDVWLLDAISFWNQQRLMLARGLGGIAIDHLGAEDPLIWQALRDGLAARPGDFVSIPPSETIATIGQGDFFVEIDPQQQAGHRAIELDRDGFWQVRYLAYPELPHVMRKGGQAGQQVALTFDDGPDPQWTPQILDILKANGTPATFFVIGEKANAYPGLLKRIDDEGHEIGNHSFSHIDLTQAGSLRIALELNATQRAIERITGHSTLLFRPPYDADRTPHTRSELESLAAAHSLGYIPVMSSIDPCDWQGPKASDVLKRVQQERLAGGQVILLHDGGGDRTETLLALPEIIRYLKARGDEIVPLHRLLGVARETLMPPIPSEDPVPERLIASTGLQSMELLNRGTWAFLLVVTVLLLARSLLLFGLATWRLQRERASCDVLPGFSPPVSVILPAHNEERVIAQTLTALLASNYPAPFEVVVIDDGSTDGTAALVESLAEGDRRVRLIRQPNRGKSAALRHGLSQARYEFLVMLDADTQFAPDTLTELMRPLRDPQVGAVSIQIEVAPQTNLLGRFQRLEYLSAFNLDRRAHDLLDAIPVVPGAASAYRIAAIRAAGGIQSDTLAEDTDLTLALHRAGYRIRHTNRARVLTEAPRTLRALFRQRRRWAYGTLQCLWKHRSLCCNPAYAWLGLFVLPSVWFFQIFLVALMPLIDLGLILTLMRGESGPLPYYLAFFILIDLAYAWVACWLAGEPVRTALLILPMRFIYRPLLGLAVIYALYRALRGTWMAWGRQERWGLGNNRNKQWAGSL
ncbi:glycosyltransferase [Caldichromatium japonicum]|uniref:Glycosyltransferase n=1 Tax=Caldichromatium japonicum TaxID=2699430 RepID=A0A6G7VE99_9GAMM|nr:glycosyltransferase [Caldichromatium japonicum]QIK38215.1 glycosyltransferase [Caldichromatium japonicum]